MASRDEILEVLAYLRKRYYSAKFENADGVVESWCEEFRLADPRRLRYAAELHVKHVRFFPSISEIHELLRVIDDVDSGDKFGEKHGWVIEDRRKRGEHHQDGMADFVRLQDLYVNGEFDPDRWRRLAQWFRDEGSEYMAKAVEEKLKVRLEHGQTNQEG